jgi:hypothetical protein
MLLLSGRQFSDKIVVLNLKIDLASNGYLAFLALNLGITGIQQWSCVEAEVWPGCKQWRKCDSFEWEQLLDISGERKWSIFKGNGHTRKEWWWWYWSFKLLAVRCHHRWSTSWGKKGSDAQCKLPSELPV